MSSDTRLIERWLPIAALGEESVRERTPMTPFPAHNRLHVWWARRPLVASRAAVLGFLLPADADREKFLHVLGIHGDPVRTRRALIGPGGTGEDTGCDPYGYSEHSDTHPTVATASGWAKYLAAKCRSVLDPTAGGGSIPFEAARLGVSVLANDLNPVATTILFSDG